MQLEDYFTFESLQTPHGPVEMIRVKGSRIDIQFLVEAFREGASPERIRAHFPTLSLEQVYATLTYYLHNRDAMEEYIRKGNAIADQYFREWEANPPEVVKRLRKIKEERSKTNSPTS